MSLLDIIIINYNSTDYLLRCLRSVYDSLHGFPAKVLVQDNASEDGVDRVKEQFPQVVLSKNGYNMGFAKAVNNALRQSAAPYVILLNPDTVILEGFFESSLGYIENNLDVGVVGPRILNGDGTIQGSARSFPTPLTALFGRTSLLTRLFPNNPVTRANLLMNKCDGRTPIEVNWVSGACMILRRKAIDDVGFMDTRFFIYWEDADWCRRMWQDGWKVVYLPHSAVIHYVGVGSAKRPLRSLIEFHKSSYKLFSKYARVPLRITSPLVAAGLALRFGLVVLLNMIELVSGRVMSLVRKNDLSRKEKKVKILRIITRLNIGGPAIHAQILTKGLDEDKFKPILVSGRISRQEGDMSYLFDSLSTKPVFIPELRRDINPWADAKVLLQIFKLIRKERPDIIHTHTAKAGFSGRLSAFIYNLVSRKRIRVVHTFHGHILDGYFGKTKSLMFQQIESILAKVTDMIVAVSKSQKRELAEKYSIAPEDKIRTIELGFDLQPFLICKALKGRFRRSFGIDTDTLLVGVIGRLVPIKNHEIFFQAAKIFLEQNPGVRTKFIVVGDGEMRHDLEEYCRKLEVFSHVVFCGWIKNVSLVYADLDILALTSLNEGTPVSIIEAMASCVPVISSDAGGVLDLLGPPNGVPSRAGFVLCERGILCKKNDVLGLAKGLRYYMEMDIHEKQELLSRAHFFVKQKFSKDRLLTDIEKLYLELVRKDSDEVSVEK